MAKTVALDFKQFKHESSDDKSTTLVHKDGHKITLAHKALSPENRKQLEALCSSKEKMYEGGKVEKKPAPKPEPGMLEKAWTTLTEDPPKPDRSSPSYNNRDLNYGKARGFQKGFTGKDPEEYAEGGQVEKYAEGTPEDTIPEALQPISAEFQPPPSISDVVKPNLNSDMVAEYNAPFQKIYEEAKQGYATYAPGMPAEKAEAAAIDAASRAKEHHEVDIANAKEDQVIDADMANQKIADQNVKREALGMPPLPRNQIPQDQVQAAAQQRQDVGAPQQAPVDPNASFKPQHQQQGMPDKETLANDMYSKGMAAIDIQAKAQEALGQQQAQAYKDKIAQETDVLKTYQEEGAKLNQERSAIKADIANGHIDPERYWSGYTTSDGKQVAGHSKVSAAIGMILAGFNPTNNPNAAIQLLNKQMDMGLESQKQNLNNKHNLLSANLAQYKNLTDATMATRLQMNDAMQDKLGQAAAKATSAGAKAAALAAQAQLAKESIPIATQLAANRTVASLSSAAQLDPSRMNAYITALEQVDPKKAEAMRERAVPGMGFANTPEGAKGMREMGTTVNTVKQSVDRLRALTAKTGKSLSLEDRAEADTLRSMLIGQLRVPITGPGAMSEGERALLERSVPDVTSMFSLDSSNKKRLDTLEAKIAGQYRNMAVMNGLRPPAAQVSKPVDKSQQALQWAKANPNNPDAAKILKKLGQK